jgi:hypothetical protein
MLVVVALCLVTMLVAQAGSLLFRRLAVGWAAQHSLRLRIANPRYVV